MIRNVIFDFGQVMVHFEPSYMVGKYVSDPSDRRLLEEVVFDRLYWDRLDAGTITDGEVVSECKKRLPEHLHDKIGEIYYNWIYNLPEMDGMRELVHDLKSQHGVGVYLLSNISEYFAAHKDEIPSLGEFDGCVFSATCGFLKPHADIFEHICERFSLVPDETVFIDDSEKNVKGARDFGLHAYLFDGDARKLRKFLDDALK